MGTPSGIFFVGEAQIPTTSDRLIIDMQDGVPRSIQGEHAFEDAKLLFHAEVPVFWLWKKDSLKSREL